MREELDPMETSELVQLLDQWRERIVVTSTISIAGIVPPTDDLALSARVHAKMSAKEPQR